MFNLGNSHYCGCDWCFELGLLSSWRAVPNALEQEKDGGDSVVI